MNYSNIKYFSTVNGKGVRTAIFVSGCRLHCKGCFNHEAWDFNHGNELTDDKIDEILESIEPQYISGLSILGGEPLDDKNAEGVLYLINKFRDKFGYYDKDIWLWTGYKLENNLNHEVKKEVMLKCDYIIDGAFESDKYNSDLMYRGSHNQRIYRCDHKSFCDVTDEFKKF